MKTKSEIIIDKCIDVIKNLIQSTCDDHTPYWGPCGTCGRYDAHETLPSPDVVIKALNQLKTEIDDPVN